ncbi:hypothetical protein [Pseudomonas sp. PDNC002]|uniref:hypothetical protein n=1 Tax=Pseudomonas sp. PDNC002 TaxID=2811422 RepID=UPI001F070E3A|nr:hypothetical protein [Pseudomonas sp. PDNC002]
MSAQESFTPYGPAAYRAGALPALAPAVEESGGIVETPLKWGHYAGLDSPTQIKEQLEEGKHLLYETQEREERKQLAPCDAERWRFDNTGSTIIPKLIFLLQLVGCGFPWVLWSAKVSELLYKEGLGWDFVPIVVGVAGAFSGLWLMSEWRRYAALAMGLAALTTASFIAWHEKALWGFWSEQTAFWLGAGWGLMGVVGASALMTLYALCYRHDGSEFNRRDGMLRMARTWWRKPFVAPFYEFDPTLQLQILPHGGRDYVLWLRHRYTSNKLCLAFKIHSLGLDRENALAVWDTLQRYMDVEQPLPDLPILEQSRHLDPVTAAHDTAVQRSPRYWRDIDIKAWARTAGRDLRAQVAAYPWQQEPCIREPHVDPQLSVEAYYRSQEAKGIVSTPKGDDFDDVHRG